MELIADNWIIAIEKKNLTDSQIIFDNIVVSWTSTDGIKFYLTVIILSNMKKTL